MGWLWTLAGIIIVSYLISLVVQSLLVKKLFAILLREWSDSQFQRSIIIARRDGKLD